jgi:methyltransferase (TIGR00027 family)
MNIEIPTNLKFISIDFEKDILIQKLIKAGFQKNKTCLFLLEGLTMYLDSQSIDSTFSIIKEYSGKDSVIIFDYVYLSVLKSESQAYGAKGTFKSVEKYGEKWTFGIEKGQINHFLDKYEFELTDEADPTKLEERFFKVQEGNKIYKVNGAHCIVKARKK